jgi:hypothetical protein
MAGNLEEPTMSRLLIQNADALTLDEQNGVLKNTNIAIDGMGGVTVASW